MAPANLTTILVADAHLVTLTNTTKKLVQREKRIMIDKELERYETTIQDLENQYQQGLNALEQFYIDQTYNGIFIIDMIKKYFTCQKEKTLHDISNNLINFRINLIRRRRRFINKKKYSRSFTRSND